MSSNKIPCCYYPLNGQHAVKPDFRDLHLSFCRKNNYVGRFKSCPYNIQHLIPEPEFLLHLEECTDRIMVESFEKMLTQNAAKAKTEKVEKSTEKTVRKKSCLEIRLVNDLFVTAEISNPNSGGHIFVGGFDRAL